MIQNDYVVCTNDFRYADLSGLIGSIRGKGSRDYEGRDLT